MSRDYGDLEREFIEGLADDTGRDLAAWMALIDGRNFAHRNDMIDWLRQQGLTFAKASRLERIHNNGGKALYGDRQPARAAAPASAPEPPAATAASAAAPIEPPAPPDRAAIPAQGEAMGAGAAKPPERRAAADGDLSAFLARAKGYRPLAELLLRAVREAVPATTLTLHDTHIELSAPTLYGAIAVTGKDVRLVLDLGDQPFDGEWKRLRLPGIPAALTHTIIISDARRVDAPLKAQIAAAARPRGG